MGRTEFLPQRLEASPGWKAQTTHESKMALFNQCMPRCAQKVFDTADIVRDGDLSLFVARRHLCPTELNLHAEIFDFDNLRTEQQAFLGCHAESVKLAPPALQS